MNSDNCYGTGTTIFPSDGFFGIPMNWVLQVRGYNNGNCNGLRELRRVANINFACPTNGWFSSGGYGFTNKKRRDVDGADVSCTKPDLSELSDGVQYNIADLDDDSYDRMVRDSLNSCIPSRPCSNYSTSLSVSGNIQTQTNS